MKAPVTVVIITTTTTTATTIPESLVELVLSGPGDGSSIAVEVPESIKTITP